ncbi:hypothetical protein BGW39_008911 [Mortierella sp. 14UC]|nr:hypothetical protein BGW39_008911 [Mortierella sp. 14UC]
MDSPHQTPSLSPSHQPSLWENSRRLIKVEQSPDFDDIVANGLALWCVAIPINDGDDEIPLVLDNVADKDKKKLSPATRLAKVFRKDLPEETAYIIVQRPPPATPVQPVSVPQERIEQELVIILNGVQHHHTNHPLDPKELEMAQKAQLGPFFFLKRTLPYDQSAKDISQVMLGLGLDKQARTTTGETLRSIVEDDIGKSRGFRVVAMVASSGSGKAATVIDLATKQVVIYCICLTPHATVPADFNDLNFITLATDVEDIYATLIRTRGLLLNNPALDQLQFFREQTTTGAAAIGVMVNKLRQYDTLTIHAMLRCTQTKLHLLLVPRRLVLVNAVNKAQAAAHDILANKFISPSALIDNKDIKDAIFDAKNQIQFKHRRGFLTPLSASLSSIQATLGDQATLDNVIDRTIEHVKRGLRDGVQSILESDKTGEASRLLCRMVLANHLHGGKISFSSCKQSDFVNKVLCRLRQDPDGVLLIMDEPIVVKAVEEELKMSGKNSISRSI